MNEKKHAKVSLDMKLYIAGVYHFDPLGRNNLRQWLQGLASANNGSPAFIATEWDENLFALIKGQRRTFRELAQKEWPNAASDLLDTLERSLGYEADTHTEFFPNVEVLWLDQGRQAIVERYAEGRLNMYRSYLEGEQLPTQSSMGLAKFSAVARQRADSSEAERQRTQLFEEESERDTKFASLILERIAKGGGVWAIAIVGGRHASEGKGSMRQLLEEQGQLCEVTVL